MESNEARWQRESERQAIEGIERIPLLALADFVAVAPGIDDEPPDVMIRWGPDVVERPYPGTAIWRAALERYLSSEGGTADERTILRPLVADALRRFASLEAWLRWVDHERRRRDTEEPPGAPPTSAGPMGPW